MIIDVWLSSTEEGKGLASSSRPRKRSAEERKGGGEGGREKMREFVHCQTLSECRYTRLMTEVVQLATPKQIDLLSELEKDIHTPAPGTRIRGRNCRDETGE